MEYLKQLLEEQDDIKDKGSNIESVKINYEEEVDRVIDEMIEESAVWKYSAKDEIAEWIYIYKKWNTITDNIAEIYIYLDKKLPRRSNWYRIRFIYETWAFTWNRSDKDEWTWLRVIKVKYVQVKRIKDKKLHPNSPNPSFKKELKDIEKIISREILNNPEYNTNLISE